MIDQTRHRLTQIRHHLHHLIDHPPNLPTRPRPPTRREQDATDRRDGRFSPTPPGTSRPAERADPTLTAILHREQQIQHWTTLMWQIVTATADILQPPPEPPTRLTPNGRHIIDDSILRCRTHIDTAYQHLHHTLDILAEQHRLTADDEAAHRWTQRARTLDTDLRRLANRIGPSPVRMCRAGCGAPAPPYGQGATCVRCRQRHTRLTAADRL